MSKTHLRVRRHTIGFACAHVEQYSAGLCDTPSVVFTIDHETHTTEFRVGDTGCARHSVEDTEIRNTAKYGLSRYCYESMVLGTGEA